MDAERHDGRYWRQFDRGGFIGGGHGHVHRQKLYFRHPLTIPAGSAGQLPRSFGFWYLQFQVLHGYNSSLKTEQHLSPFLADFFTYSIFTMSTSPQIIPNNQ